MLSAMLTCNRLALGALAALVTLGPAVIAADDAPPYASATEAYRQGADALKSDMPATAVPALEYAAKRGVLGAQIKLARAYSVGREVPKDDAKAFTYFEQIADQQADISPSSPIAKYAAEAFVALGQYYLDGIPAMPLASNPVYAVDLFRHAASYFGDAEAQYRLARLYMNGTGVEKNVGLAVNWLAIAAKKQHAASQATLGEILWRGQDMRQRKVRGLALIILAHENAVAAGKEPSWIGDLYKEALGASNKATRKDAEAMLPELGGVKSAAAGPAAKAKPAEIMVMPAGGAPDTAAPTTPTATSDAAPLGGAAPPPASMGLSVGFGAGTTEGGIKP
jgi:TPR repeat protein